MNKIKAVLFDMDGVLIDAKEWHYTALNKALALFGYEITRAEHVGGYDGLPTAEKLKRLTQSKGLPAGLHSFINEMKQQYTVAMIQNFCRPRFNHEYAVATLKARGYRLAVCSNSIRNTVELMMKQARLADSFDLLLSNQDIVKAKPDPEIYLTAMARLSCRPQECLVVEDNENGIRAALASGAHLLQVNTVDDVNFENIISKIREIESR